MHDDEVVVDRAIAKASVSVQRPIALGVTSSGRIAPKAPVEERTM